MLRKIVAIVMMTALLLFAAPPVASAEITARSLASTPDHAVQLVAKPTVITIKIVSVTSPVKRGQNATLVAKATSGAYCTITVYYKSGPSKAKGLEPKNADKKGSVSWTWKVGTNTTPGKWKIVVTAGKDKNDKKPASATIYFEVIKK